MPHFAEKIDWERAWLASVKSIAGKILAAPDWRIALNAATEELCVRNHRGRQIQFVPQEALPEGLAYEAFIGETGMVPTRENLHDFFNAMVWLSFPAIKQQLNRLQAAEIARAAPAEGGRAGRGMQRDGATIFDENAALLISSDADMISALQAHEWQAAFLYGRATFDAHCEVSLFGHALMEKLVAPYKAITAHVWVVRVDAAYFLMPAAERRAWIDHAVAAQIADGFATNAFTPLPILGVPGWWAGQDQAFYQDATVFRPKRIAKI